MPTIPSNPTGAIAAKSPVRLPTEGYRKAVVISLLGTALIISLDRSFRGNFPRPRVFVALLFIWIVLGFLAEFAPKLAAYFGGLVFTGVLLSQGPYVFQQINKRIQQESPQKAKPKSKKGAKR